MAHPVLVGGHGDDRDSVWWCAANANVRDRPSPSNPSRKQHTLGTQTCYVTTICDAPANGIGQTRIKQIQGLAGWLTRLQFHRFGIESTISVEVLCFFVFLGEIVVDAWMTMAHTFSFIGRCFGPGFSMVNKYAGLSAYGSVYICMRTCMCVCVCGVWWAVAAVLFLLLWWRFSPIYTSFTSSCHKHIIRGRRRQRRRRNIHTRNKKKK